MGVVFFCAATVVLAQTYKWTDDRGVTTYGTSPPAGRPAQRIDTQPLGPAELTPEQRRKAEADARRRVTMQPPPAPPLSPVMAAPPARGMRFDTYIRLERGMSEGELLLRAGQPDEVALDDGPGYVVKSYYYLPTAVDPFVTIVSVYRGRIANLERTRKF